jgi:hypothetical protein
MSEITPESPPTGDRFMLPKGIHNIKHLVIIVLGVAWIGATCALITLAILGIAFLISEESWNNSLWSDVFLVAAVGMALSTIIITIIASVKQAQKKIEKGFSAWIEKVADLSITQHGALLMVFALLLRT